VLAALDGWVRLRSVNGVREVPWHEYFLSVFLTSKEPDELLTQVVFPRNSGWEFTFNEIARRQGDYPLAGLCSGVRVEDGRIAEARLAAIAVSDRPVRLTSAENALVGVAADDMRAVRDACAEAAEGLVPTEDLHGTSAHRKGLLVTLARRSMADLLSRGAA
jgi:carbon-monoxide dehydrogenase medium subunit